MTPKAAEIHHTIPIIGLVVPSFWNRTARGLQGSGSLGSERRNIGASRFSARNGGDGHSTRMAAAHSSIMRNAACRSPGFNLRNSVRAFLMSCSAPDSVAALKANVAG